MKEIGLTINKKDKVRKPMQINQFIRVCIKKGKKKGKVLLLGLRDLNMREVSLIITSMGLEHMYGQIKDNTQELGLIIKCMVKEHLPGKMAVNMLETTYMTRNKEKDHFSM